MEPRELDRRPDEALSPRCTDLLDCASSPGALTDLLEWRFRAAGRLEQFDLISHDVERQRRRVSAIAEEFWGRVVLLAVDQLSWGTTPEIQSLAAAFWKELDEWPHLHMRLDDAIDRTDVLRDVASGWHVLRNTRGAPDEPSPQTLCVVGACCRAYEVVVASQFGCFSTCGRSAAGCCGFSIAFTSTARRCYRKSAGSSNSAKTLPNDEAD